MKTQNFPNNQLAVIALLYSASLWGLIWYPLRLLDDAGLSGVWSSLIMYLAAAVLVIPFCYQSRHEIRPNLARLSTLGLAAGITNVVFVVALIEGEVMRVMLLFYLSPLWTVLLGRWYLGEKLSPLAWLMFAVAMVGAMVMLWDSESGKPWPQVRADWLALIAGLGFSVNNVLARRLGTVTMALRIGVVWWGVVFVALAALLWQQASIPIASSGAWWGAILLGLIGVATMTVAVMYGLARMPVYRSSVIMLFELIVAAIAAWWLTNEVMTGREWFGGCLILLAAYGVAVLEKEKNND